MSVCGHAHVRPILSEDAIASVTAQHRRARLAHRQSRQEILETLQALRQQGLTYSEIARQTGYERRSIANWLTSNAPRVAAALCIKPRGLLTDRQAGKVNALKQGSTVFAIMRGLAMRFNGILRSRTSEALDEWIDDAIDTELTAIMRFASVLRRDIVPSKMQSTSLGATVKPKGRSTA